MIDDSSKCVEFSPLPQFLVDNNNHFSSKLQYSYIFREINVEISPDFSKKFGSNDNANDLYCTVMHPSILSDDLPRKKEDSI